MNTVDITRPTKIADRFLFRMQQKQVSMFSALTVGGNKSTWALQTSCIREARWFRHQLLGQPNIPMAWSISISCGIRLQCNAGIEVHASAVFNHTHICTSFSLWAKPRKNPSKNHIKQMLGLQLIDLSATAELLDNEYLLSSQAADLSMHQICYWFHHLAIQYHFNWIINLLPFTLPVKTTLTLTAQDKYQALM